MSRELEAAELTGQAPDLGGPREEEQTESDFVGDENVTDESEDYPARCFWICAYPLASKKATDGLVCFQTILRGRFVRGLTVDFTETPLGRSVEEG